jgi:hypothetical protein
MEFKFAETQPIFDQVDKEYFNSSQIVYKVNNYTFSKKIPTFVKEKIPELKYLKLLRKLENISFPIVNQTPSFLYFFLNLFITLLIFGVFCGVYIYLIATIMIHTNNVFYIVALIGGPLLLTIMIPLLMIPYIIYYFVKNIKLKKVKKELKEFMDEKKVEFLEYGLVIDCEIVNSKKFSKTLKYFQICFCSLQCLTCAQSKSNTIDSKRIYGAYEILVPSFKISLK